MHILAINPNLISNNHSFNFSASNFLQPNIFEAFFSKSVFWSFRLELFTKWFVKEKCIRIKDRANVSILFEIYFPIVWAEVCREEMSSERTVFRDFAATDGLSPLFAPSKSQLISLHRSIISFHKALHFEHDDKSSEQTYELNVVVICRCTDTFKATNGGLDFTQLQLTKSNLLWISLEVVK